MEGPLVEEEGPLQHPLILESESETRSDDQ